MTELKFLPSGNLVFATNSFENSASFTWTKGVVMHSGDKTAAKYEIKTIGDTKYLFLEMEERRLYLPSQEADILRPEKIGWN